MLKYTAASLSALLIAGAAAAQTADTTTNWAGPYVGVHVGYGFDNDKAVTDTGTTANNIFALDNNIRPRSLLVNRNGALAGGQAGWNFQSGRLVYGVEGDFSVTDIEGGTTYRSPFTVSTFAAGRRLYVRNDTDWIGSARARVGYTMGRGMIYATGGYAFGRIKGRAEFDGDTDALVNYAGKHKYIADGWTAGAGLEFKPLTGNDHISIRAEALYYDLGKSNIYALQTSTQPGFYRLGFDTRGYNGRIGVNYAF